MKFTELREHLARQDMTQKDAAVGVLEWLKSHDSDDALNLNTVETKLSKLISGNPEGLAFFRQKSRLSALEVACKLASGELTRALGDVRLLIDPKLPADALASLRAQAANATTAVEFIEVPWHAQRPNTSSSETSRHGSAETRLAIRDASDANPDAVVVLTEDDDLHWFAERKRTTTSVEKVPRGFEVSFNRGLLPVPPPSPPERWSGETPLVVDQEFTAAVRAEAAARGIRESDKELDRYRSAKRADDVPVVNGVSDLWVDELFRLAKRVFEADARGETPTFPLSLQAVVEWIRAHIGDATLEFPQRHRNSELTELSLGQVLEGPTATLVWWRDQRLFAFGPHAEAFAAFLAPHHTVEIAIPELLEWRAALDTANPFAEEPFSTLTEAAKARCGLGLKRAWEAWREQVAGVDAISKERSREEKRPDASIVSWQAGEERSARALLQSLATRQMRVPHKQVGVPFILLEASRSEMMPLQKNRFDVMHLVANVGAGRLLRIRIAQFDGDGTGPLAFTWNRGTDYRSSYESWPESAGRIFELDGDGTHVWVESFFEVDLEGSRAHGRSRRYAAATAAAKRAADDD